MPEITSSSTAPGSLPKSVAGLIPNLSIPPYGVETFTDTERGLRFTTLHFKHGGGDQAAVLTWIGSVLKELAGADLPASGPCDITLTPDVARSTKTRVKFRCHLKVPIELKVPVELPATL